MPKSRSDRRSGCAGSRGVWCAIRRQQTLDFQLPQIAHPDERVYRKQIEVLRRDHPASTDDHWYRYYPDLAVRVAALVTRPPAAVEGASLEKHLEAASAEFVHLRATVAWLSVLLVPATYLLARRFLERRGALLAAGLAATSVLDQW